MMRKFVDLNRSFAPIPRDHAFKEDDYDLSISFGLLETKKWGDLLQLRRVIILAEAGAGKTEEIRATTKRLRNDGRKAFFFRLEHLSSNFEASFEIGNNADFEEWLSSDESGWFFLDSVDEAGLCGPKQFEAAIRNFGVKLGNSKQRAFDKNHYKKMVVSYLKKFGEAKREDIDKLLLNKISDALDEKQKRNKIRNLLFEMSHKDNTIFATGPRRTAAWVLRH